MTNYSKKERQLFRYFNQEPILDISSNFPPMAYMALVCRVFANNLQGPEVESVRRCYKALSDASVGWGTPEWEELISFNSEQEPDESTVKDLLEVVRVRDLEIEAYIKVQKNLERTNKALTERIQLKNEEIDLLIKEVKELKKDLNRKTNDDQFISDYCKDPSKFGY